MNRYGTMSREFLRKAREELAAGDMVQASEKAWGAAAQAVKAAAEWRGWTHRSHAALFQVAGRVATETGDPSIRALFLIASGLHQNFYEHRMTSEQVEYGIEQVGELLAKLEPLGQ